MKKFIRLTALLFALMLVFTSCNSNPPATEEEKPSEETAQTDTSWDYIKDKGEIIMGLDDTFAPMGFRDDSGEIVGFDVDFAAAVAEELGVKIKLQPIDWNAKELELSGKKIDVIWNGMSRTPDRVEKMTLSNPYLQNAIVIMTMKGSEIQKKADIIGKKIGIQVDSAALETVQDDAIFADVKDDITEYKTYDEACMDLEAGRVDVVIIDKILGMYKSTKKADTYAFADEDFGPDLFVVGMRKEDKAFAQELQKTMDKLKSEGKALEISQKWFSEDLIVK